MTSAYKCPNLDNCATADKGVIIEIPPGERPYCPDCGSRLIATVARGGTGLNTELPTWVPIAVIALALAAVALGAYLYLLPDAPVLAACKPPQVLDAASGRCVEPAAPALARAAAPRCGAGEVYNPDSGRCATPAPSCQPPAVLDPATGTCAAPAPAPRATPEGSALLRFHGSNTIGGKLLPALAEEFLRRSGYAVVQRRPGGREDELFVVGETNGEKTYIEIEAHGSKTAFEDLKDGRCDIGMASRPIKPEEKKALAALGDLGSTASEHVLALDGIAVIVHPANPVKNLTLAQLADIFGGAVTDWAQVGGRAGPVAVYARDEKSGTWDFFNDAVLKRAKRTLVAGARRFEDSRALSEAVGGDPAGIGFIGLNYVGANKVLGLADSGVEARKPSLLTIKTEDYLLSRRLFLYTAERPANPNVWKFIDFAVGAEAQPVIKSTGLVNMDLTPLAQTEGDDPRGQSARWRKLTAGAAELPTRFRFTANSNELDTRANRDIGRIVYLLAQPEYAGKKVVLIGFADSSGAAAVNAKLALGRAEIVRKALAEEGIKAAAVEGVGAEAFVAPNDTEEQRGKNRRVEVWVK